MLYYGKKSSYIKQNFEEREISDKYKLDAITERTAKPQEDKILSDNQLSSITNIFNKIFNNKKELYYEFLEDNFENLSTDDKINLLYNLVTTKSNLIINCILIIIILLILILIKLFSN